MERALRKTLVNGEFRNTTESRSKLMSKIHGKNNKSTELRFRLALVRSGTSGWKMNLTRLPGKPDFYFEKSNLVVFIDGCFWHNCPKCGHIPKNNNNFWKKKLDLNKNRDKKVTKELEKKGFIVIRFWEHEIKEDVKKCIKKTIALARRLPPARP